MKRKKGLRIRKDYMMETVKLNNDVTETSLSAAGFFLPQDRRDAFQGQGIYGFGICRHAG